MSPTIYSAADTSRLLPLVPLMKELKAAYSKGNISKQNYLHDNLYAVYADDEIQCYLDAQTVIGIKTAAVTMLAINQLYPYEPQHVAIYGAGKQAQAHIKALLELYPNLIIDIIASNPSKSLKFVQGLGDRRVRCTRIVFPEVDVVITATTSKRSVYSLQANAERIVIGIGAQDLEHIEIGRNTINNSTVYVDDIKLAQERAGDLVKAEVDWSKVLTLNAAFTNVDNSQPILFKQLGSPLADLAVQKVALNSLQAKH